VISCRSWVVLLVGLVLVIEFVVSCTNWIVLLVGLVQETEFVIFCTGCIDLFVRLVLETELVISCLVFILQLFHSFHFSPRDFQLFRPEHPIC
jgi:hypothetical protein